MIQYYFQASTIAFDCVPAAALDTVPHVTGLDVKSPVNVAVVESPPPPILAPRVNVIVHAVPVPPVATVTTSGVGFAK